jgi:hypothetical protein
LTSIERDVTVTRVKISELIAILKELRESTSRDAAVWLNDGQGGGWPIGDLRLLQSKEIKRESTVSKPVRIAIVASDDDQKELKLRPLIRRLSHYPEGADVFAEVGNNETSLLPVSGANFGKARTFFGQISTVVISAGGNRQSSPGSRRRGGSRRRLSL